MTLFRSASSRVLVLSGAAALSGLATGTASAQSSPNMPPGFQLPPGMQMPPGMPMPNGNTGRRGRKDSNQRESGQPAAVRPPGVPITMDSAAMKAFLQMEQHSSYRMRFALNLPDPMMAQMLAQMGMGSTETAVSNGVKLVTTHMKMPATDAPGQVDDWEIRAVSKNGRAARMFSSAAVPRLLAKVDAQAARQMEEINRMAARSIAQSLASGPTGWVSAGVTAASTALSEVELVKSVKMAHEFFEWQCVKTRPQPAVDRSVPPPLTDLSAAGDRVVDGTPVTSFQFFVHDQQKDEYHGPMLLHIAKDSGLPFRIEMSDPQMRGVTMNMDYYDVDKVGTIETPPCMDEK